MWICLRQGLQPDPCRNVTVTCVLMARLWVFLFEAQGITSVSDLGLGLSLGLVESWMKNYLTNIT